MTTEQPEPPYDQEKENPEEVEDSAGHKGEMADMGGDTEPDDEPDAEEPDDAA